MFSQDFREFIELLNKNDVQYLIVGGYAVGIHGYPRFTGDLDIWLLPDKINAQKILVSIQEFGFSSLNISGKDFLQEDLVTAYDSVNDVTKIWAM